MGLEVYSLLLFVDRRTVEARSKHQGPGKGTEAGSDMDRARASKVVKSKLVQPSARVPLPVCKAAEDKIASAFTLRCQVKIQERRYAYM